MRSLADSAPLPPSSRCCSTHSPALPSPRPLRLPPRSTVGFRGCCSQRSCRKHGAGGEGELIRELPGRTQERRQSHWGYLTGQRGYAASSTLWSLPEPGHPLCQLKSVVMETKRSNLRLSGSDFLAWEKGWCARLLRWKQGFVTQSQAVEGRGAGRLGSIPGSTAADWQSA